VILFRIDGIFSRAYQLGIPIKTIQKSLINVIDLQYSP